MRTAIIGSGFIGHQHAQAYAMLEDIELAAIVDANEAAGRAAAEKYGCNYYGDAEEMLAKEEIDFVDICVPTFLHKRFAKIAADHGKHILCEKPFALSEDDCAEIIAFCDQARVRFMVAQCERWMPYIHDTKQRLSSGKIGNVHLAVLSRLAQHPDWTTWHRDPKKSGGGLFDLQVHDIDLLVYLFGEIDSVSAIGWQNETGCWNHVSASLIFKNGVRAVSEASNEMIAGYPFSLGLRITGDLGGVEYSLKGGFNIEKCDELKSSYVVYQLDAAPEFPQMPEINEYAAEIKAFADAIKNGSEIPIPVEESRYVIRVTEAIRDSLENGTPIKLD